MDVWIQTWIWDVSPNNIFNYAFLYVGYTELSTGHPYASGGLCSS